MEKREKFEVNVIVQMPECCKESMCDKCIEDYEEQLMTEAIESVAFDAIELGIISKKKKDMWEWGFPVMM